MSFAVQSRKAPKPNLPPIDVDALLHPGYTKAGQSKHTTVYVANALGPRGLKLGKILAAGVIDQQHERLQKIFFSKCVQVQVPTTLMIENIGLGAYHYGEEGTEIYASCTPDFEPWNVVFLYLAEVTEVFGARSGRDWLSEWSHGEALSRVAATCLLPGRLGVYATVPSYVKDGYYLNRAKADWITKSLHSEEDGPSIAAGVCFLHYLHDQLGIPWDTIVNTPGNSLELKFRKLTGRAGGFNEMCKVLAKRYPLKNAPALVGDNPFPIH